MVRCCGGLVATQWCRCLQYSWPLRLRTRINSPLELRSGRVMARWTRLLEAVAAVQLPGPTGASFTSKKKLACGAPRHRGRSLRPSKNAPAFAPSESARSSSLERPMRRRGRGIKGRPTRWGRCAHMDTAGRDRSWGGHMPQTAQGTLPAPCATPVRCVWRGGERR